MNITITFGTNDTNFSIWQNGSVQNTFALARLLKNVKDYNVRIVNLGIPIESIKREVGFDIKDYEFYSWEDVKDNTDLLIESSIKLKKEYTKYLRDKGTKIVLYRTGNAYIIDIEDVLFGNKKTSIIDDEYDEIWTLPHHKKTNYHYLSELYNTKVYILPYIWDDRFIKGYEKHLLSNNSILEYKSHKNPKNITIFEPNLNVVKTSIYPLLIVDSVYKENPELIDKVRVLNSYHMNDNERFLSIVNRLKIFKDEKVTFESRYPTPFVLSRVTDIVVSHQWENELNNLYFDVLYSKYPFLHNSETLKKYGTYYEGFNVKEAKMKLKHMLIHSNHDNKDYKKLCESVIYRYSSDYMNNVHEYKRKIDKLIL